MNLLCFAIITVCKIALLYILLQSINVGIGYRICRIAFCGLTALRLRILIFYYTAEILQASRGFYTFSRTWACSLSYHHVHHFYTSLVLCHVFVQLRARLCNTSAGDRWVKNPCILILLNPLKISAKIQAAENKMSCFQALIIQQRDATTADHTGHVGPYNVTGLLSVIILSNIN